MTASAEHSATIAALFSDVVETNGAALAVRCGAAALTYAQLDAAATRLAGYLQRAGIRRGAVVAVSNDHSLALPVSLLAIAKAGAAYLGVDGRQPAHRVEAMLTAAGVDLVLADGSQPPDGVSARWTDVSALDLSSGEFEPGPVGSASELAYLAYTSGTTGEPKAAMITHAGVLRLVRDANFLRTRTDDVFLALAPLAFDASTLEIWAPLLNGATLVIPAEAPDSVAAIAELVERERVTVLWLTAGLFHQFCTAGLPGLSGLRCLLMGGDVLSVSGVNRALADLPGVTLVNGYGPTENTTFTSCHRITEAQTDRVPIGTPVSGTTVHLLDERLRPVGDGEAGELCTGGLGLARGYLDRPAVTAERFVPDPYATTPGGRLYRTGDLVRRRPDGALDFLGRLDDQVKIRGFRVELGEVEAALRGLVQVADAAVTVQQSRFGRRLVGFAVPAVAGATPITVRRALAAVLPDYAVPSAIVLVEDLPLKENGKVDRSRLASRAGRDRPAGLTGDYRAPGSETEQAVAEIWELLMDVTGIGADDDFFELGGDSLTAVAIATELTGALGVELGPRQLYENPTVAELADLVGTGPAT